MIISNIFFVEYLDIDNNISLKQFQQWNLMLEIFILKFAIKKLVYFLKLMKTRNHSVTCVT